MTLIPNTSARVKALADWVVTSSCALEIVSALDRGGEKILWAPDQHLGRYVQRSTPQQDIQQGS